MNITQDSQSWTQYHANFTPGIEGYAPEDTDELQQVVFIYVIPLVATVGVVCNLLSVIVLFRDDTMIKSTSLLLRMLAVADLLNILFTVCWTSYSGAAARMPWFYHSALWYIAGPLALAYNICQSAAFTASVWFQVLLTAERYIAVCKPLHVSEIVTTFRIRASVVLVWVCSMAFSIPRMFDKSVLSVFISLVDNYGWIGMYNGNKLNDVSDSNIYRFVYLLGIRLTVDWILPFVILTFCTARAIYVLKERCIDTLSLATITGEKKALITKEQRRTTVILTLILIIFVITQLPVIAVEIRATLCSVAIADLAGLYRNLTHEYGCSFSRMADIISKFFVVFQSTANYFIFSLAGKRYRDVLKKSCTCKSDVI